ncbi:imidazole glycerol phosphate synthase cyclase subunit [Leptospira levettii]|uniref:AglZ/HisF2 family acetamidino modification protein n=1 Tax=Leptospira levettii TaxID=2023178 RepID=UPI001083E69C|nr:AglZ/HisF2 family acetamidino modification protein [Leptospira levettii]MCG6149222.1 AglZ/HisF2 family acetamidino modification protein [Leptospira levettii]MCW7509261.1 AglZ/HisF2 family acetamidino modification protein [Leptospira levettii]MCW7520350.1 AglZ/HisF2 family acetamidino modification protein [Leptospira levettii]TGK97403.1 imidazole glycerol phosphate synthase cyclase subunit [Leptospira levettii]TGL11760.1 imidazole glycerol phosphate synthase cyclase subunit [Leptospira levet
MLKPRIIPTLLLQDGGLVKTTKFDHPRYIGDPINAVKIFNEKEADELVLIDIDASRLGKEPDYRLIERIANECRMPLSVGGGIKSLEQANKILGFGVEKVIVSSLLIENPKKITEMVNYLGSQSVVVCLDVKKTTFSKKYEFCIHNGRTKTGKYLDEVIEMATSLGAGEILINSIDLDGMMTGYDLDLIENVKKKVTIPITTLGGAGSLDDIKTVISKFGVIGVAAGSLFIYKGKLKAVLINYPNRELKTSLYQ